MCLLYLADKHLFHLPERRTDKALIIVKNEVTYKLNVAQNRTIVHVKRYVDWTSDTAHRNL